MNTVISILMTFLLGVMTVRDFYLGRYVFAVIFLIEMIAYLVWVIPTAIKNDKSAKILKEMDSECKTTVKEALKIIEDNK